MKHYNIGKDNPFYGREHSAKTKKKMSKKRKGIRFSEPHKKNIGKAMKGKPMGFNFKSHQRASKLQRIKIEEKDLAYIAGIIDGEGYLSFRRTGGDKKYKGWELGIGMGSKEVLDFISEKIKSNPRKVVRREKTPRGTQLYRYSIVRVGVLYPVLKLLLPYLKNEEKIVRAEKAIKYLREKYDFNL